ncbi:MAG: cysteine desulfurase [Planctomycetota bacterium]|nr:cysteine desulfurase [Planctomycetota bacterium]MCX8040733.1 cysteine desulfurase [Planctomycetota bacterium]MDW8372386.1 cysteine desulfurase [Planctomycetota bacterium]
MSFDPEAIRSEFPGLAELRDGRPYTYLDSAATAHKPRCVIERVAELLGPAYGTVHRGLYRRAAQMTERYEQARRTVARFLDADPGEIVFTAGCTDALNLVAHGWGRAHLRPGDRILVSGMEHHAGLVSWHTAGFKPEPIPLRDDGSLDLEAYDRLLAAGGVKLVGCVHISNALGTINPVAELARRAHAAGALFCLDAAQSAPHLPLSVRALGCDFLAFAGHKVYGPTGIGVLWARRELLEAMPPWRGGGEMIERVSFAGTTYAAPPARFEAGTPPFVEAIGLATALEWLMAQDRAAILAHERAIYDYAERRLAEVPGLRRIGTAPERGGALSFVLACAHPADIAAVLDAQHIAIRAGHHCAQPVMERFRVSATARASIALYTTRADIDRLHDGLQTCVRLFG